MIDQARLFQTDGEPIFCAPYGNGHINETYLLVDSTAREYILQKINKTVFRDPESLMKNISAITAHLRKKGSKAREALTLIPARDGREWLVDGDGEHWRLYQFITDSICLDRAADGEDFRESALAFGRFQRQLADFPAQTLTETIPRFHDTPYRYMALRNSITDDAHGRAEGAKEEIEFALAREAYAPKLLDMLNSGKLPLRVTHNDTKLNNVLFDRETRKALCVIDLDTVMPGLSVNDFGDSIRFGASTAAEDERDLSKVSFSLTLFQKYTEGFLSAYGDELTECERAHLRDGAKMMTLECGVRFLTDYLSGDIYFRTGREGQNLDRCRTQFKLVEEMEINWEEMRMIVDSRHVHATC